MSVALSEAEEEALVLVVEDDTSVRLALESLLRSAGYVALGFGSAREYLAHPPDERAVCLICDVRLPQMSGLDLQDELRKQGQNIPIIFLTGHGDIPMSVRAMKAGAVDFLPKPFRDQDLLDAVSGARVESVARREKDVALADLRERFASLTQREREVLRYAGEGLLNKQIAGELALSEMTVKLHRSTLMKKMGARSFAQLVRMAETLSRAGEPVYTSV